MNDSRVSKLIRFEGAVADAVSSETLCDDVDYIETLRVFLKFLEEMREK